MLGFATVGVLAATAIASPPSIGMTSAQSGVTVDNAAAAGNATVFDGSTIQTKGYSRVQLNDGARLGLGAGSRVQVFSNRLSLQSGAAEVQSQSKFEIDAGMVKIVPSDSNAIARVKLDSNNLVLVTALNSPVSVTNREGVLVARVMPGLPLSFMPQAGSFDGTGCVLQKTGAAILTDASGNQVSELRGADLRKAVGNTVHVRGTILSSATPAGGASQVVTVSSSEITAKGGCSAVATKLGATTSAAGLAVAATTGAATGTAVGVGTAAGVGAAAGGGAAAGAGLGTAAIAGIVVGGAAAVSVGAAAAAGAFKGSSN